MSTNAQAPSPKEMQLASWTGVAPGWYRPGPGTRREPAAW